MAEKKEKQYVSDNAQLMAEWNWEKNDELGIVPQHLTCGSGRKVWWKCAKEHEWRAIIANRNRGVGCPYCAGSYVIRGENDLLTVNPTIAKEWDYEKNGELTPADVLPNSNKKVWWKCSKGHEWQATIAKRSKGNGCPYCSGKVVSKGYNDLPTLNPALVNEWNFEKNGSLNPESFTASSHKMIWWKCNRGHEWQSTIANRNNGNGCPYCSSRKVLKGYNDLQTINPSLAEEWNYEKNNELTPADVLPNSNKKVWWKCSKGHEWQAAIAHRNKGEGCPICHSERHTSLPEYMLVYYFNKYGVATVHSYRGKGYELDVYIPSKKVAIEYDGYYWHKNSTKKDLEKNIKCKKDKIKLYRIREGLLPLNSSSIDYIVQRDKKDLEKVIKEIVSEIIGTEIDVDLTRDAIVIENLREYTEKDISLLSTNPEIAAEWNYDKNGKMKPEGFFANSNKKVWWKCSKGHEWQARIADRSKGKGCPFCAGKYIIQGENDLQTTNPILADDWNYEKNNGLTPLDVMPNSVQKVWWKCSKGHEWQARIDSRNKGSGCPFCSGRYVAKGETDLQTVNPSLANEWNYDKNGSLKPEDFTANSGKKVWWKCSKGHEWQATIANRNYGYGCPQCAREKRKKSK